ncbi:MAG: chaperone modulator CbpM [Bacillota bacterium]
MNRYEITLSRPWGQLWPLEELALAAGIHPQTLEYFVDYGLVEPMERIGRQMFFPVEAVSRVKMIQRLRTEMGVNLAGIAVILDLINKIRDLQQEVECLRFRSGLD